MRNLNSKKFDSKLHKQAANNRIPITVLFELTYKCNHKCVHCFIVPDKQKQELSTNQIFSVIDQLYKMGTFYIHFTGGEIFMREDIFDILFYAKEKGFKISILTNGSLIDENIADEIAKLSPRRIEISILGSSQEVFDSITKVPGSFEKVYRGIRLLKDRNQKLVLKTCLMRQNLDEWAEMKNLSEELNIRLRYNPAISPKLNGDKEPLKYRVSPYKVESLRREIYSHLFERCEQKGVFSESSSRDTNKLFNCDVGKTEFTISPYGLMRPCVYITSPQYDIINGTVKEEWDKIVEWEKSITPGPDYKCDTCDVVDHCFWCPARGFLEENSLSACSDYYYKYAKLLSDLGIQF